MAIESLRNPNLLTPYESAVLQSIGPAIPTTTYRLKMQLDLPFLLRSTLSMQQAAGLRWCARLFVAENPQIGTVFGLPNVPTEYLDRLGIVPSEVKSGYGQTSRKARAARAIESTNKLCARVVRTGQKMPWMILQESHSVASPDSPNVDKMRYNYLAVGWDGRIISLGSDEPVDSVHQHVLGEDGIWHTISWKGTSPQFLGQKEARREVRLASKRDITPFAALLLYPHL